MLRLRRALLLRAAAKDINLMSGGSAHVCAAALAVRGQPVVIGTLCCWFQIYLRPPRTPLTCQSRELSARVCVAALPERSVGRVLAA